MNYYLYLIKYYSRWVYGNLFLTRLALYYTLRFLVGLWRDKGRPSLTCGSTADGRVFVKLNLEEDKWKNND